MTRSPMWPLEAGEMKRHATISECGRFRYRLWRKWGCGSPLLFVMLNPSKADGETDDATIRRCLRFAEAHNFGEMEVVNLFAYRATDPWDLKRAGYPVGPENDRHIAEAVRDSAAVCVAWGSNAAGLERPGIVLQQLRSTVHPGRLFCLRITRGGYPQHPLMLPSSCRLVPFAGATGPHPKVAGAFHSRAGVLASGESAKEQHAPTLDPDHRAPAGSGSIRAGLPERGEAPDRGGQTEAHGQRAAVGEHVQLQPGHPLDGAAAAAHGVDDAPSDTGASGAGGTDGR